MKIDWVPDKFFYFPVIVLLGNFLYRLVDESKILFYFPFDFVNDISSYMAQLFFLDKCGFLGFCPYWYNGFVAFKFTPPAWYFFAWPLYKVFGDVKVATFFSMLLIFLIGFLLIYFFGRAFGFSVVKRAGFFAMFFGNAIAVGNFIRLGRVPELFSWMLFAALAFVMIWYKDNKLDGRFFWSAVIFALILLSHQTTAVLSAFFFLSLFLVKSGWVEKLKVVSSFVGALVLSSFWLVPYVRGFSDTGVVDHVMTVTLFLFDKQNLMQNIGTFIIPALLFAIFYFYWISEGKSRKDVLFFGPFLVLAAMLFLRITPFVPVLKYVYPDPQMTAFIFIAIFLMLKTDFFVYPRFIMRGFPILISVVAVGSVLVNMLYTPVFAEHNEVDKQVLSLLEDVDGRFWFSGKSNSNTYSRAFYSYGPVYLNLSSASGWYPEVKDHGYIKRLREVEDRFISGDCGAILDDTKFFNVSYSIGFGEYCSILGKCGFLEVDRREDVCLYKYEEEGIPGKEI